jgi:hypothetical protein
VSRGAVLLAAALAGCLPYRSAYVEIPAVPRDGRARAAAVVRAPLAELRRLLPGCDVARMAFHALGRQPCPHRLVDEDGDGAPDAAWVQLPVAADGSSRLIVVCPGAGSRSAPSGAVDPGVELRFTHATR